ncbi:unnamed protein product, partial [marine sediment metagenome]
MLLTSRNNSSVGKIAEPDEIIKIGRLYGAIEMDLKMEFRQLTPFEYTEMDGTEFKRDVKKSVKTLNRGAIKWSKSAVADAYIDAKDKAMLLLDIMGATRDPLFDERIHRQTILDEIEITNDVLMRANITIDSTADTYTYLIRSAAKRIATIQSWDMRDEEIIS